MDDVLQFSWYRLLSDIESYVFWKYRVFDNPVDSSSRDLYSLQKELKAAIPQVELEDRDFEQHNSTTVHITQFLGKTFHGI